MYFNIILKYIVFFKINNEQVVISVQKAVAAGYSMQRMQFQSAGGVRYLDLLVRTNIDIFKMVEPWQTPKNKQ